MPVEDRADPVLVSRHLSFAVGADLCYGKWGEGSYTTGKPSRGYTCNGDCFEPSHWTGTLQLLAVYNNLLKPVQYCQCFVYSGVLCTMGRTLGFPTRIVSNFQSAHDTEKNRAIDQYYEIDEQGYFTPFTDDKPSTDSIWSFHVWNEVFIDRPAASVTAGCKTCANGWNAIDATPQEFSSGGSGITGAVYQMGPASVRLVKRNLDKLYDNEFVISEVNANLNLWVKDDSKPGGFDLYFSSETDPVG